MTFRSSGGWDFYGMEEAARTADPESALLPNTVAPNTYRSSQSELRRLSDAGARGEASVMADNAHAQRLRHIYAQLYPYQRELFRVSALQDSLIYLQTGGGKTWVAAALIALHLAVHSSSRVFFVVRTVALAAQQHTVLQGLLGVQVACVAGGAREFRTPQSFCDSPHCRVAVIIDAIFFQWLSASPELITQRRASLVLLDEAHHAQSGPYKKICEQLHSLRDGAYEPGSSSDGSGARERLRSIGERSAAATVLTSALEKAEQVDREQRAHHHHHHHHPAVSSPLRADEGDEGESCLKSPVLDLLLHRFPRDLKAPQLIGLSASPVVHFGKKEREMVELLLVMRCRLVGVVNEVEDLKEHRPNPAIAALSYLPLYEERVLQSALRRAMAHVYRRMEALVPEEAARKRMDVLRTTSVVSPGFAVCCDAFSTDVAMTEKFMKTVCIPPGSVLVKQVQQHLAEQAESKDTASSRGSSGSVTQPPPTLSCAAAQRMCIDFLLHGLKFLKAVSTALIALQEMSCAGMLRSFYRDFSPEELERIASGCGPITALVLRPVLESMFKLMMSVRMQHPLVPSPDVLSGPATTPLTLAPASPLSDACAVSSEDVRQAERAILPQALRDQSTHTQVLMRLFTELAIVAVAMSKATSSTAERNLRVLVFVEKRDSATDFMRVLSEHCSFAYKVLRPKVLMGQKNGKGSAQNYMTRAEQTALLDEFRKGTTHLVFATTVAEEGIDVPACHVVMRCDRHTELRSIVQSCGRLRMKNTLFISLSNLLNGHPRLGFVMDAIHDSEAMLNSVAQRCRADAWRLGEDELSADNGSSTGGPFSVNLPVNTNESTRITTQEATLVSRQRSILLDLQREHQTEVFCIHNRGATEALEPQVRVTVMMLIPLNASERTGGLAPAKGQRWDHLSGSAAGGLVKAGQKAFVNFCLCAQQKGYLTAEGRLPTSAGTPSTSNSDSRTHSRGGGAVACRDRDLAALNVFCSYARQATPNVVFLGSSLCLCSRKTWPPSVLEYFSRGRASVMTTYNHDLWCAPVEPQTVLRGELAAAGASVVSFHISKNASDVSGGRGCTPDRDADAVWPDSVSEVASSARSAAFTSFTTPLDSRDSRNLFPARDAAPPAPWSDERERAELEFLLPLHNAENPACAASPFLSDSARSANSSHCGNRENGLALASPPSTITATSTETTTRSSSGCSVAECVAEVSTTDKLGKEKKTRMRRVRISYQGVHARKVVSLAGLQYIGVQVVYGMDKAELIEALSTCRQVGDLD